MTAVTSSIKTAEPALGTLEEVASKAARWWLQHTEALAAKEQRRTFRRLLAAAIVERLNDSSDYVWIIGNHGEPYPLLTRLAREAELRGAKWPTNAVMWLRNHDGIARVSVLAPDDGDERYTVYYERTIA